VNAKMQLTDGRLVRWRGALSGFSLALILNGVTAASQADVAPNLPHEPEPAPSTLLELEALRGSGYEGPVDVREVLRGDVGTAAALNGNPIENFWSEEFSGTGLQWVVNDAVIFQGRLIIGGLFSNAGGTPGTEKIAAWNGQAWESLGGNLSVEVFSLAVYDGELYVGGGFLWSSGAVASFLARWDGATWRDVGNDPNDWVYSLHVADGLLYVGGVFTNLGGINASRIAAWNGTSWSALGAGLNASVYNITSLGGDIVVGGNFTASGAITLNHVARWTGTNWEPLGAGTNDDVLSLAVSEDTLLYAGGWFTQAGGVAANRVACWDGSNWSALGSGVNSGVNAVAVVGTDLWVGGFFTTAGGVSARALARWDGAAWSPFGTGLALEFTNGRVESIIQIGDAVYVGGFFQNADGNEAINLAAWTNGTWLSPTPMASTGNGSLRQVYDVAGYGNDIFIGGTFVRAGGQSFASLARYDGTTWHGTGDPAAVACFEHYDGKLLAGGDFTSIQGTPMNRIGQWNGVSWQPFGGGMGGTVLGMTAIGSDLYAVGFFTQAGGVPANRVARWDGTTWHPLGTGISGGSSPQVWAVAEYNGEIYVGGKFTTAGSVTTKGIARWNGTIWQDVGGGVLGIDNSYQNYDPVVYDFALYDGKLIVGGDFTRAGGQVIRYTAAWDGTSWSVVGSDDWGARGRVFSLEVYGGELFAGGYCYPIDGSTDRENVVRWNGSYWSSMALGTNDFVNCLRDIDGSLYAGGAFTSAGEKSSFGIAKWTNPGVAAVGEAPQPPPIPLSVFPNPSSRGTTIQFDVPAPGDYGVTVYDPQGRRVRTLSFGPLESGPRSVFWDGRDNFGRETAPGVYFLKIEGDTTTRTVKLTRTQ
jgi:hypothetical protein